MKKKLGYILAFLIPVVIFFIAATLNDFIPFGKQSYAVFDSSYQYPGFFVQFKNFSLFNFTGGLGLNFIGIVSYYLMSPLNLIFHLIKNVNYHTFIAILIYIKIGLASLFMYCYLAKGKKEFSIWTLLLSLAYGLCGMISCYYYNTMWMDGIYMLPLVLIGIDKLINEDKKLFYLITLTITILLSYYIGYMVCIFSVIYFIYKILTLEDINKKEKIKSFLITSLLAGLISAVILLPAIFALMQGKGGGFSDSVKLYFNISSNLPFFFFNLTPGSFQLNDHTFGPAQIYSTLFAVVLTIMFFFNTKFTKKHKLVVLAILIFYFLSFNFNLLDYMWQFFQRPVWWQSRYSFTFSAFLIIIAHSSISNIDGLKMPTKKRVISALILVVLVVGSCFLKYHIDGMYYKVMAFLFILFSCFLIFDYFLIVDNKKMTWFIVLLIICELFIHSFNNLKNNNNASSAQFDINSKTRRTQTVDMIKDLDDGFYRMEFVHRNTSNDGMFYDYNGITYFNSVRNQRYSDFAEYYIGLKVDSNCGVNLNYFNPYFLSLLNVKYLVEYEIPYYKKVVDKHSYSAFENPYPLSVGFMVSDQIKDVQLLKKKPEKNIDILFEAMINDKISAYKTVEDNFKADKDYIMIANENDTKSIQIDKQGVELNSTFNLIKKGSVINSQVPINLLDVDEYERVMKELSDNLLEVVDSNHVLEGNINVTKDKDILLLTIPFDEGLRFKIDGKEVKPIILFDTFIGLELTEGEHNIQMDYTPVGLKSGIIVSSIGVLLSAIYLTRKRKI